MSDRERNKIEVIFSSHLEAAKIELYDQTTGHTINPRHLKPLLRLKPGRMWGDSDFVILTVPGCSDICLGDIGFKTSLDGKYITISLNQAMWLIDFVSEVKKYAIVT
jgi:hypothetical protein